VLLASARGDHVEPRAAAKLLAGAGLTDVLLEGGGTLAAAWLRAGLVDELHWFVSAKLLGDDARPALGALAIMRLSGALALRELAIRRVGDDVYVRGRLRGREER
jgi:diaminohydroxyphosphoribosylaminopyrimidine deaminase/5-amino-6-(5-phosphoribosylamino)uracil reductase